MFVFLADVLAKAVPIAVDDAIDGVLPASR